MTSKKILSSLLAVSMLASMLPTNLMAVADDPPTVTITPDKTKEDLQGSGSMNITLSIQFKNAADTDFDYSAPTALTYDGTDKTATVAKDSVTGMGAITVHYYSDAACTTEVTETKNAGIYYVGITLAAGTHYGASTSVIHGTDWKFEIIKSTPDAPDAPTMASSTKNSITLATVDGCEYSKDGTNWQDSPTFSGFDPQTEYTLYQRLKETANTNPSAASSAKFSTTADTYGMTITLQIKTPEVTAPTAKNPTYYSSPVQLISKGTVPDKCTMYYMISDTKPDKEAAGWESDVTKITENSAGTYKVWYKVTGGGNYTDLDVCAEPITVTVTEYVAPTPTYYSQSWTLTMDSYEYDGTAHTPTINGRAYTYSSTQVQYTYYNTDTNEELDAAPSAIGNYKVKVYADGGSNYYGRTQYATYSITDPIDKNGMANVDAFKENDTVPVSDGKIFAGWFTDETCTTAYTEDTGKAYAKFIDEKILTVKAQITSNTTANSEKTSIRFITSVDSLKYQNVGFKITCNGKTIDRKMTKVYTAINAGGAKVKPTVFSEDSRYMEAYTLNNITKDDYGKAFTVTPYYTTQDGTIVEGKTNTFTIANMIK